MKNTFNQNLITHFVCLAGGLACLLFLYACNQKPAETQTAEYDGEPPPTADDMVATEVVQEDSPVISCKQADKLIEINRMDGEYEIVFNAEVIFSAEFCETRNLLPEAPFQQSLSYEEFVFRNGDANQVRFLVESQRMVGSGVVSAELSYVADDGATMSYEFTECERLVLLEETQWYRDGPCNRLEDGRISLREKGVEWPRHTYTWRLKETGSVSGDSYITFISDEDVDQTYYCWDYNLRSTYFDELEGEGVFADYKLKPEFANARFEVVVELSEEQSEYGDETEEKACIVEMRQAD